MVSEIYFKAFLFGITLSIAVGPIALIIIRNGIQHGRGVAIKSALGAAFGDLLFSVVAFTGASLIAGLLSSHQKIINTASAVTLILFGLYIIYDEIKTQPDRELPPKAFGFSATLALTISNPLTILAISAFATQIDERTPVSLLTACLCLFAGSLLIQSLYALGSAGLKRFITNKIHIRFFGIFSGLGIIIFGLIEANFLWR